MTIYILVSLHTDGAEQFCSDFHSLYMDKSSYYGQCRVAGAAVEFVVFGSQAKLTSCKLDYKGLKKEVITGTNASSFFLYETIKVYVESKLSSYGNDSRFYILNDVNDICHWESPRVSSNSHRTMQSYFSQLVLVDLSNFVLHDVFGCGPGCNQACPHCRATHKICDEEAVKQHTTMEQIGLCMNSGCTKTLPICQRSALLAHSREHVPPCQSCKSLRGSCLAPCWKCKKQVCGSFSCPCVEKATHVERIKRMACPTCAKDCNFSGRLGLESHFQHCKYKSSWKDQCPCGLYFVDHEHKNRHIEGKKGCKLYIPPLAAVSKKYEDDRFYLAPTKPTPAKSLPTPVPANGLARSLVKDICRAFEKENHTMYSISEPELSHYREISDAISTILRSSGIVAETKGFGSADKGTGVPGYVDVDMLVVINNFVPTKRKEYASTFRKLLQDAGANLKNSADDIQQVEFNGVEFDLVLVGASAEDNDKRAAGFAEARHNVRELRAIVKTDNYVKEVIRAVKYWSKRSYPAGGIKSCLIEAIVLAQYTAAKTELTALTSQQQRRLVLFKTFFTFIVASADSAVARSTAVVPGTNSKPSADLVTELMSTAPITAEQRAVAGQVSQQLLDL